MTDHPKYEQLRQRIRDLESVVIAFSGGTDSTFLVAVSKTVLGDRMMALTVKTPYIADWEIDEARDICRDLGVRHEILEFPITGSIRNNPKERCYLCKHHLFSSLKEKARDLGFRFVADGTNADDTGSHRPGLKALKELGIVSPLKEAGLNKETIRSLSKKLGLPTWDKPAYACLLTRIPYGTNITEEELSRIEAAETYLMEMGFKAVRVRSHGSVARIEIPRNQIPELIEKSEGMNLNKKLKSFGYQYITVDIEGYRSGSFDVTGNNQD